ncbi:quinone oxidoreductase [Sphingobium amiense]|uniref:Quinone oxidoreductase n=1 Tax=Sphingobium amiense TaxID=135719 RepID=A0A494W2X8_9SPHN|nr:quinone oxidoreductase [Sphingobium amiense]BBD96967.1 quinone oxidoreductase [Sphingobium amiense]
MKSVRFHKTGGPEVLVYEEVPDPEPGAGQILVRVEAVGMNFSDVLRRRGDAYPEPTPLPFTVGSEVAGTVAALGPGVEGPAVGTPVFVPARTGGYAQYVVVAASSAIPLPDGIKPVQATALVIQGLTALFALRNAGRLAEGEAVLIEAAAGGVGSFAVQLAKLLGAGTVIAAASSEAKRAKAISLGADAAVDYTDPTWAEQVRNLTGGRGVDVVLEMTGGDTVHRALDAMAPFARMVVYGLASGESVEVDPQRLMNLNQSVVGFYIGGFFANPDRIATGLSEIVAHVQAGRLELQIGGVMPLSRAADAHRLLEGRGSTGKLVLKPWDDA